MSIREITNNKGFTPTEIKATAPTESRATTIASSALSGFGYCFRAVGSAASYIPGTSYLFGTKDSKTKLLEAIESLPPSDYENLLQFIASGDPSFFKLCHQSILQELGNNWPEIQKLLENPASLSSRILEILGTAQSSPLTLFQFLKTFSQPVLWENLQRDMIAWPIENWDEAVISHGLKDGKFSDQFYRDYSRSHYIVQGNDFPIAYKGDKLADLKVTLQKLSVFKKIEEIPLPIQEALTQSTAISYLLMPLWISLNAFQIPPPNMNNRTFILENGDDSHFFLTVKEETAFCDLGQNPAISFEYSYRFKVSKITENEWVPELLSLSPLQPKIGTGFNCLLETIQPSDSDSILSSTLSGTLLDQLVNNLKAAAQCDDQNPEALDRIEKQIQKQWEALTTQFDPAIWKSSDSAQILQTFNLAETAKSAKGLAMITDIIQKYQAL